jgi:hypothetical protein
MRHPARIAGSVRAGQEFGMLLWFEEQSVAAKAATNRGDVKHGIS